MQKLSYLIFFIVTFVITVAFAQSEISPLTKTTNHCFSSRDFENKAPKRLQRLVELFFNSAPEVCTTFSYNLCSNDPHLRVNMTLDGKQLVSQEVNDRSEVCGPAEGQCKPCIGLKKGSLILKPNHARICPDYRLDCTIMGLSYTIDPEDKMELECYDFGEDCNASTCGSCLKKKGCGWCGGEENDSNKLSTGSCMALGKPNKNKDGFEPEPLCGMCANKFSTTCPAKNFPVDPANAQNHSFTFNRTTWLIAGSACIALGLAVAAISCLLRRKKSHVEIDYDLQLSDGIEEQEYDVGYIQPLQG